MIPLRAILILVAIEYELVVSVATDWNSRVPTEAAFVGALACAACGVLCRFVDAQTNLAVQMGSMVGVFFVMLVGILGFASLFGIDPSGFVLLRQNVLETVTGQQLAVESTRVAWLTALLGATLAGVPAIRNAHDLLRDIAPRIASRWRARIRDRHANERDATDVPGTATGDEVDVFVSYSRVDRLEAQALIASISSRGHRVWYDGMISAGEDFGDVIDRSLKQARCAVVLWSRTSITRRYVRAEALDAWNRQILVPAVLAPLEASRLPVPFNADHTYELPREHEKLLNAVDDRVRRSGSLPAGEIPSGTVDAQLSGED